MPQLKLVWWGINFIFCWYSFFLLFIYLTNVKFFSGVWYMGFSYDVLNFVMPVSWKW